MSDSVTDNKRPRDDDTESPAEPDTKRIRADLLFSILDDESEPDNSDLDYVIRSLEEEIALPETETGSAEVSGQDPKQPDLGFLLEASDDELGLPPPESADGDVTSGEADVEAPGFGKIWGLDEEFHLDFGFGSDERKEADGGDDGAVSFDGGWFDFDGGACGAVDFSDLTWRPEYLPAV